jgi:hypothetical protein
MSNIYIVHPIDENLAFFKKTIKKLSLDFPGRLFNISLTNKAKAHSDCLSVIKNTKNDDLICFFCHGRTDGILGCSYRATYPTHRRKYEHGLFVSASNIEIFRNKKIFCLACNSNQIARIAMASGVKVFLGFDEININDNPDQHIRANAKFALRRAIYLAINLGIQQNYSFNQLADYLGLFINKVNDDLILRRKRKHGYRYYLEAANITQEIKEGIRVWGDGTTRLND